MTAEEFLDGASSDETRVRLLNYGPIVNEFHHAAMYGPQGNALQPTDVAASPNLGYPLGTILDLGDGVQRRVADWSYRSPGVPTHNTIEVRDRLADGHATATPSNADSFLGAPPQKAEDFLGPAPTGQIIGVPESPPEAQPEPPKNPDPYQKELEGIAKNLATSPGIKSQRDLEDLAAKMPDFQQQQEAASQSDTRDKITKAIGENLTPLTLHPVDTAYNILVPTKENTLDPMREMFTNPKKAFSRDVPLGSQEFYNELLANIVPVLPHGIKLGKAGLPERIRARLEGRTEGAEAAAPAENPASAQSTILEDATQAEPPLDVKGTQGFARFQGEQLVESGPEGPRLREKPELPESDLAKIGAEIPDEPASTDRLTQYEADRISSLQDRLLNNEITQGQYEAEARQLLKPSSNGQTPQPQAASVSVQPNTPEEGGPSNIPTRTAGELSNGTRSPETSPLEVSQPKPTQAAESAQAPVGAANRVSAARDEAGLLGEEGAPESGRGIGYQESVAEGNKALDDGTDPYKVASDFKKNGLINRQRMGVMRAHLERLQLANARARGALEAAPGDLKLRRVAMDAQDAENAFWRAFQPMKTEWSNIGTGLQESRAITDADVHSQTTAEQAMRESLGRELTPKDQQRAARAVKSVKEANGAVEKSWSKAVESASKKAKGPPMEYAELTKSLAEKLKEITC